MQMRILGAAGALALAAILSFGPAVASAQVADEMRLDVTLSIGQTPVADFQDEFSTAGFPPGWQYLYNASGPLGNPANYVPLTPAGGQYTGPSGNLAVGQSASNPLAYPTAPPFPPTFPTTFVRPGLGSLEDPAGIERAAILAYTFQASDFAAAGATGSAPVFITAYDFAVSTLSTPDGLSARIYSGRNPTPLIEFSDDTVPPFPFPPGFRFETTLDPNPIPLGTYSAGDTIYFAIGGNAISTPEPAAMSLLVGAALLLTRRRREK